MILKAAVCQRGQEQAEWEPGPIQQLPGACHAGFGVRQASAPVVTTALPTQPDSKEWLDPGAGRFWVAGRKPPHPSWAAGSTHSDSDWGTEAEKDDCL